MSGVGQEKPLEIKHDADLNAACNLALRAIAAPDAHDLLPRLRCRSENGILKFVGSIKNPKPSKRDERRFVDAAIFKLVNNSQSSKLAEQEESGKSINVFVDLGEVAAFERVEGTDWNIPLATGKGLWGTIKQQEFAYCLKINRARLQKWKREGKLDDISYDAREDSQGQNNPNL
jgi:hypothetical protein